MSKGEKKQQSAVHGKRRCKLNSCSKEFTPKKNNQEFCCPNHKDEYHKLARQKGEAQMNSKGIHFAKIKSSPRLQRVVKLLSDGQEHSTRNIVINADVMAVSTVITELRKQLSSLEEYAGFKVNEITCNYKEGNYYYKMINSIEIHHHIVDKETPKVMAVPIEEHKEMHGQKSLF